MTTQFTTSPSADVEPPSVIIVTPGDRSGGVTPSMDVTLTFSEAMNPLTLDDSEHWIVRRWRPRLT